MVPVTGALEFKITRGRSAMMPPIMLLQQVYYMIATMEILPTDKFTIAVNDEHTYDYFFRKPPISLKANIYVMLVDLDIGKVIKEEKLSEY